MKKIVTIGGGNGHSAILKGLFKYFKENNLFNDFSLSAIVSMSDDGRTTGLLMRTMQEQLNLHMPPPGDLRKCSLAISNSIYRDKFSEVLETVMEFDGMIIDFSLKEMLVNLGVDEEFIKYLEDFDGVFLNFNLPLDTEIKGHKFGNIMMASLYYNFGDYDRMLNFLGALLEIKGKILPITTDKAFIFAELDNYELIDTQDRISNEANYKAPVKILNLARNSRNARLNPRVSKTIMEADYIIIGPGDLYTSIDANFLIEGFSQEVKDSKAKKIYIMNSNNKRGETTDYNEIDFVDFVQNKIGIDIDLLVANKKALELNKEEQERFLANISVKGGRYLFIDETRQKQIKFKYPHINFLLGDYVDRKSLYKNNEKMIEDIIKSMS